MERRLVVLKGILESEEVYLNELEALLMVTHAHTHKHTNTVSSLILASQLVC